MIEASTVVPAGDLTRLRQINERAVLDTIRTNAELRLAEIAKLNGLTRASVGVVVRGLMAKGWVAEEAPVAEGRGRPAHRYRFRAGAGYVAGLDIGAHTIRAAVADLNGKVLAEAHALPTQATPSGERVEMAGRVVADCMSAAGITAAQVWATAAASTGRIDADGTVSLSSAIADWAGVNLVERLRDVVPGLVIVENDVQLATLAEQQLGAAAGVRNVIVLQAGHRMGLGLVVNGQLHRGHSGVAGDLSPFSAVNGDHAIGYLDLCQAVPADGPTGDHVQDVLSAAGEGDPAAVNAVRRYARATAEIAATAVSLLDPEMLVLSGILSSHTEIALPILIEELELRCLRTPELRVSSFGPDAVALGAICRALGHLADTLLGPPETTVPYLRSPAR